MLDFMTEECPGLVPERRRRKCNPLCSCCCDVLWQSFICFFWCRYLSNCAVCNPELTDGGEGGGSNGDGGGGSDDANQNANGGGGGGADGQPMPSLKKKKTLAREAEKAEKEEAALLSTLDNFFYFAVYIFLVTDFFVRIYPILLFAVVYVSDNIALYMEKFYFFLPSVCFYIRIHWRSLFHTLTLSHTLPTEVVIENDMALENQFKKKRNFSYLCDRNIFGYF